MANKININVMGIPIRIIKNDTHNYVSLTDMVHGFGDDHMIYSWMRNRNTLEFIGIWEHLNNADFKGNEFVAFKKQAGLNNFNLTPRKWSDATNAIGIVSKAGRHGGGTYAHQDIAFEFGSWLSPEFKLYPIKEFQRLKEDEYSRLKLDWSIQRTLAKVNYKIHTDAIKETLIPQLLNQSQVNFIYASEADILNVAIFGMTAKEWRNANTNVEGNIRDMATIEQLVVLSNMESINALLIGQGYSQSERIVQLNSVAITQMKSLLGNTQFRNLE